MTGPSRYPESREHAGMPRWVKVLGIVVAVVVLLVVAMMFIGGGEHGPGRHTPSGDAGGQVPPSSVVEDPAPPEGGRG
jgi:hypothetical protein